MNRRREGIFLADCFQVSDLVVLWVYLDLIEVLNAYY